MWRKTMQLVIFVSAVLVLCGAASAATPATDDGLSRGLDLLFKFFILSVVVEVAFSTLFQWKIYLKYFHDRGLKTPIVVLTSFLFCNAANLNIVGELVTVLFGDTHRIDNTIGRFLTALLLAGGSSGMNTLFSKLKIRDPEAIQKRAETLQAELETKKTAPKPANQGV